LITDEKSDMLRQMRTDTSSSSTGSVDRNNKEAFLQLLLNNEKITTASGRAG